MHSGADYASIQAGKLLFFWNLVYATRNFSEMLLVLAVLDLPFEAGDHDADTQDRTFRLKAKTSLIAFHEELLEGEAPKGRPDAIAQPALSTGQTQGFVTRTASGWTISSTGNSSRESPTGAKRTLTNPTSSRLTNSACSCKS